MRKLALIGEKLGHSYSKIIHERYFELSGKNDFTYDLIEIPKDNLDAELARIAKEYEGINVTIPYKLDVMKYLDFVSPEARKIGAVNTIKFTPEGAFGYNTDYFGFKHTLEVNGIEITGKDVVILGTGGASKAVLAVCEDLKAGSITFVSIEPKPVDGYKTLTYADEIKGDVLINCTPVGMYPKTGVSPLNELDPSFRAVVDVIYNPSVTKLMEQAVSNGAKAVNGLYMLVSQAMYSEGIWNAENVNDSITDTIYEELKKQFMKILIINGPNINFVGIREKGIYGTESYEDICKRLTDYASQKGFELEIWQSNHEGAIIDKIQSIYNSNVKGVVINPGAYTHYSYAISDAIKSIDTPFIEVHFSDINSREDFRKISVTKAGCIDQISGFGPDGYFMAVDKLLEL